MCARRQGDRARRRRLPEKKEDGLECRTWKLRIQAPTWTQKEQGRYRRCGGLTQRIGPHKKPSSRPTGEPGCSRPPLSTHEEARKHCHGSSQEGHSGARVAMTVPTECHPGLFPIGSVTFSLPRPLLQVVSQPRLHYSCPFKRLSLFLVHGPVSQEPTD